MAGDLSRNGANILVMQALSSLSTINERIEEHQLLLATGKHINSGEDYSAGYQFAQSFESRRRGLLIALDKMGTARNVMIVAEGGYQTIVDLLLAIPEVSDRDSG